VGGLLNSDISDRRVPIGTGTSRLAGCAAPRSSGALGYGAAEEKADNGTEGVATRFADDGEKNCTEGRRVFLFTNALLVTPLLSALLKLPLPVITIFLLSSFPIWSLVFTVFFICWLSAGFPMPANALMNDRASCGPGAANAVVLLSRMRWPFSPTSPEGKCGCDADPESDIRVDAVDGD
jgi:hypothetical protein